MIRGLYSGAAAMDVISKQHQLISDNLANLNTSGHRIARFAIEQRENPLSENTFNELGPETVERLTDFSNGRLHHTGRALDASLVGDGFFAFEGPSGLLYSRGGQFYRNVDSGNLVNNQGYEVQGDGGPINIPDNVAESDIVITPDGTITSNGEELGQLRIVSFEDNQTLFPISQSVFQATDQTVEAESTATVVQFNQELSNGNPVSQMIALISGTRQYEAVQKATTAQAESLREHIRA